MTIGILVLYRERASNINFDTVSNNNRQTKIQIPAIYAFTGLFTDNTADGQFLLLQYQEPGIVLIFFHESSA